MRKWPSFRKSAAVFFLQFSLQISSQKTLFRSISRTADFDRLVAVTGGVALSPALSLYPFGIKEGPKGISLAMYPLVGFAFQAQGYVSKGRRFLSDAPPGRFS